MGFHILVFSAQVNLTLELLSHKFLVGKRCSDSLLSTESGIKSAIKGPIPSLFVKPWNSVGKHTVQDSDFVRWSSAFHHVFVFTDKKRCVLFIDIVECTL